MNNLISFIQTSRNIGYTSFNVTVDIGGGKVKTFDALGTIGSQFETVVLEKDIVEDGDDGYEVVPTQNESAIAFLEQQHEDDEDGVIRFIAISRIIMIVASFTDNPPPETEPIETEPTENEAVGELEAVSEVVEPDEVS